MIFPEGDIIGELTASGARVEDYLLIGDEICVVNKSGELLSLLVEDLAGEAEGEMHLAIVAFLRRIGAKCYRSHDEYHQREETAS